MIFLLLLIGLLAGILAGLLGIGGGILFTPALFLLFHNAGIEHPVLWSIGSSLFCTFVSALSSSIRQRQQRNFYWQEGLSVGLFGIVGTFAGKQVTTSPFYSEMEFTILFSLVLLFAAYMFLRRGNHAGKRKEKSTGQLKVKQTSVVGGIGGFLASLAGIGGGAAMVPLLNLAYHKPMEKAVSISSLAIVLISLGGWGQLAWMDVTAAGITHYTLGYVDFGAALPLVIGGFSGGFAGAWINLKIKRRYLQWGFAALAIVVAIKLLSEVL